MPVVHFFGGYKSTPHNMDQWVASARAQAPSYQFIGYAYPDHCSAEDPRLTEAETNLLALTIKTGDHILVGHSSGCGIANTIADRALRLGAPVRLVALDGFRPSSALLNLSQTQCWGARCGNVLSRNYGALAGTGLRFHVYQATDCKSEWALHFSLVNRNASDKTVRMISQGYFGCVANLSFLPGADLIAASKGQL